MFTQTHELGRQTQPQTGKKIYETTRYDIFSFIGGNRDLHEGKVNKLAGEIKANGLLMPIMVNGKYEVIDGQHRLMACKKIKVPVQYFIRVNATVETAANVNMAGSNWSSEDWINKYAEEGLPDYVVLRDWIQECREQGIRQSDATRLAQNSAKAINYSMYSDGVVRPTDAGRVLKNSGTKRLYNVGTDIRLGEWKCGDMRLASELLSTVVAFREFLFYNKSGFVLALMRACRIPEFEPTVLLAQARKHPKMFIHQRSSDDFIAMFDDVYNKRRPQAKKLPIKNNPKLQKK